MDAIKLLKEKNRMTKKCSIDCSDCPLSSEKTQLVSRVAICRECIQRLQFLL